MGVDVHDGGFGGHGCWVESVPMLMPISMFYGSVVYVVMKESSVIKEDDAEVDVYGRVDVVCCSFSPFRRFGDIITPRLLSSYRCPTNI